MYTRYIQSFKTVAEQAGLNLTWSKISEDTFLHDVAQLMVGGKKLSDRKVGKSWKINTWKKLSNTCFF